MSSTEHNAPAEARPRSTTMWRGMTLFILSEGFLFGSLFWSYYTLRADSNPWPPPDVDIEITLASVNTALLLFSSLTIWMGLRAIQRGNRRGLATGLAVTMTLAVAFMVITVWEWLVAPFRPWTHAYGSIFFTLTGFHTLHVAIGVLLMSFLLIRTLRGRYSAQSYLGVEIGSLYWHFVDVVWLFVFSTIYIIR